MARKRTPFHSVGGRIVLSGDRRRSELLARAWRAGSRSGVHGVHALHPWPARLPAAFAALLVETSTEPGDLVLDPFCGSGTVPYEAARLGRRALGFDAHPVAVRVARQKLSPATPARVRERREAVRHLLQAARRRRHEADPRPFAADFPPAAAQDLAALLEVLEEMRRRGRVSRETADFLTFSLSAVCMRFSRRRFETDLRRKSTREAPPPLALLAALARKAREADAAQRRRSAASSRRALLAQADARRMPVAPETVKLLLASPPYLGTYDYAELQRPRALLFGVSLAAAARLEMGPRRARGSGARKRYAHDLENVLAETARVLRRDGAAVLVVGDSVHQGRKVDALELVAGAARSAGLALRAAATQSRPPRPPLPRVARPEHAVWLERAAREPGASGPGGKGGNGRAERI